MKSVVTHVATTRIVLLHAGNEYRKIIILAYLSVFSAAPCWIFRKEKAPEPMRSRSFAPAKECRPRDLNPHDVAINGF